MKEQLFTGKKKAEGFKIYRREEMQKLLDSVEEGTELEIIIRKKKKKRSLNQNSYYWSVVIGMVLEGLIDVGYRRSELNSQRVHEYLKEKFLKFDIPNEDNGDFITVFKDTKDLSTVEMMYYIAEIQMWAVEFLNVYIPEPNAQVNLDL